MFTGLTLRRLFRRNTKKRAPVARPLSRWNRSRLSLDYLEDRRVPATIQVTGTADTVAAGDGTVTLREAIAAINAGNDLGDADIIAQSPGIFGVSDSINFNGSLASQTIGVGTQLAVTKSVIITGLGMSSITVNNVQPIGANSRIFELATAGVTFQVSDLTLSGGLLSSTNVGAAIRNSAAADITLSKVHVTANSTTTGAGGAIAMLTGAGAKLTITDSSFSLNFAGGAGGVINNASANASITIGSSTFTNNQSNSTGGVFNNASGGATSSFTATNSIFNFNTGTNGGAFSFATSSAVTITNNGFASNTTSNTTTSLGGGGAIIASSGTTTINSSKNTFNANISSSTSTTSGGGAMRLDGTSVTLTSASDTFSGNTGTNGGAIYVDVASTVTLTGDIFDGNVANGSASTTGGGAFAISTAGGSTTIDRSTFSNNSANVNGGAIFTDVSTPITINNSTFSGNTAAGNASVTSASIGVGGGAIHGAASFSLTINNSTLVNNVAQTDLGQGGAIMRIGSGSVTNITSSIIANNSAHRGADIRFSNNTGYIGGGANLIGVADDGNFYLATTAGANQTGTRAAPLDALLGPLANNGSVSLPVTFTHALLPGSPAIGQGNENGFAIDQTNKTRPVLNPSVGATELILNVPSAKSTLTNVTTGGGATYVLTVVYQDETGINTTTINQSNVSITGMSQTLNPNISGSGKSVTVAYTFDAPGGTFDKLDNNAYTVTMNGSQVTDTDGPNSVAARTFGTFRVAIGDTYTVNNIGDVDDGNYGNGTDTLREVLNLTNDGDGVADVITFDASIDNQTIILTSNLPVISDPVTIQGNSQAKTTISGDNLYRVFRIVMPDNYSTYETKISNLTMTKGSTVGDGTLTFGGGAILMVNSELTLDNVAITASSAKGGGGAIGATVSLPATVIPVATQGPSVVRINNSSITGNSGGTAGAIGMSNSSYVEINSSTLANNVATGNGGAVTMSLSMLQVNSSALTGNISNATPGTTNGGGAINGTTGALVVITNSTIGNNTAANSRGGGILVGGSVSTYILENSTVAGNSAAVAGGGFSSGQTSATSQPRVIIRSSILGDNSSPADPDLQSAATGTMNVELDNSIIEGAPAGNINITGGSNTIGSDPGLSPLGSYGGTTKTFGLLPGSPALDKGSNALGLSFDQRGAGFPRVLNSIPDVGAFEGIVPVPTAAVTLTNVTTAGGTDYVVVVEYTATVSLDSTSFDKNDVYINGPGYVGNATPTINPGIAGSGNSYTVTYTIPAAGGVWGTEDNGTYTVSINGNQVFDLNATAALPGPLGTFAVNIAGTFIVNDGGDVDDLDPINGKTTLREAVNLSNKFSSTDTILFDTTTAGLGANPTITVGTDLSTTASVVITGQPGIVLQGGGGRFFDISIPSVKGSVSMTDLSFTGGSATGSLNGGAILNADESVSLTNVTFTGNIAGGRGGAISSSGAGAIVAVTNGTFTGNGASSGGGAIHMGGATSTLSIDSVNFNSNTNSGSFNYGGAIYTEGAELTLAIDDSTFTNNSSNPNGGGAIAVTGGSSTAGVTSITINDTNFDSNTTNGSTGGGAIYAAPSLSTSLDITINDSTFNLNMGNATTSTSGGAVHLSSNTVTINIDNTSFTNNTAGNHGGALYVTGAATGTITDSKFVSNRAKSFGGAIDFAASSGNTMLIENTLIAGNTVDGSSAEGGGIFMSGGALQFHSGAIVNNAAISNGSFGGSGGGISSSSASIEIWNSTLSGNYAFNADSGSNNPGGGAIAIRATGSGGPLTIYNSTITDNTAANSLTGSTTRGGAILMGRTSGAAVSIESSIIAGNSNSNGHPDMYFVDGAVQIPGDNNIIGAVTSGTFIGAGNQTGTLSTPANPGIFPLDTVTYSMPVHPLWYNSPALNAGKNNLGLPFDVRGAARENPIGFPDVGSFEGFADVSPFVYSVSGIVNITAPSSSPYEIIVKYDGFKGVDSTTVDSNDLRLTLPTGATIPLTLVSKTLLGNAVEAKYSFTPPDQGVANTWDPTDNGSYVIDVLPVEVKDLDTIPKDVPAQTLGTFTSKIGGTFIVDNNAADVDDLDYTVGNLTLREAVKLSNFSEGDDDFITFALPVNATINLGSHLEITDEVTITGSNNLTINGGGNRHFTFNILGVGGLSSISSMTLSGGSGNASIGGAIFMDNDSLNVTSVKFLNNSATGVGGAIALNAASLTIVDSEFDGNVATGDGGAIKASSSSGASTVSITNTKFNNNSGAAGGAISMPTSNSGAVLIVADSTFTANTASGNGGAISLTTGPLTMDRSILRGNVSNSNSTSGGGGALSSNTSIVVINDTEISDNESTGASAGGGAYRVGGSGNITVQNSTVSGNSAAGLGGAFVFNSAVTATLNLKNSTVAANIGVGGGGAIYARGTGTQPTINLVSSIIAQNADTVTTDIETATATATLNVNATDSLISWVTDPQVNVSLNGSSSVGTGSAIDAKLDVLAPNGSARQTHALLAGSPALNSGSNPDGLSFDQRGTPNVRSKGQTDMGAFEDQTQPNAPTVTSITFGDGTAQRSMVTQMVITFSGPVTFSGDVTAAITLSRNQANSSQPGGNGPVTLTANPASGTTSSVTITFAGALTLNGSLTDGFYDLFMESTMIKGAGGQLDGGLGANTDYSETGDTTNKHFRIFGDKNGNGVVGLDDFAAFKSVFNLAFDAAFDFDNDLGNVGLSDFAQFKSRFNFTP